MNSSEHEPCVLCVLSDAQRSDYSAELDDLGSSGVKLMYQSSTDVGLSQVGRLRPRAVIVGMSVDDMEGLEFVALLMARYPEFDREIIVLPDKGDPFPPVTQRRDRATGRSITEHIALAAVAGRLRAAVHNAPAATAPDDEEDSFAEAVAEFSDAPTLTAAGAALAHSIDSELLAAPVDTPAPVEPEPPAIDASPVLAAAPPPPVPVAAVESSAASEVTSSPVPTKRTLVIVAAVIVGVVAVALALSAGGAEPPDETPPARPAAVSPPDGPREPRDSPSAPAPAPPAPAPQPEPPAPAVDLTQLVTLPVSFAQGQAEPGEVTDPRALDALLAALDAALRAAPDRRLEVGGHTSQEGSSAANARLGRQRAEATMRWLSERGVPSDRMVPVNYASSKPARRGHGQRARRVNRRVTLRVVD